MTGGGGAGEVDVFTQRVLKIEFIRHSEMPCDSDKK